MASLQPPSKPASDSPHTKALPCDSALLHPRSAQLETDAKLEVGCRVCIKDKVGAWTGRFEGLTDGAGTGAGAPRDLIKVGTGAG